MKKRELVRSFPPDFVSAETLAYRLDCSVSTIHDYVRRGLLPKPTIVGDLTRWDFEDVRRHIKEGIKGLEAMAAVDPYFDGVDHAETAQS